MSNAATRPGDQVTSPSQINFSRHGIEKGDFVIGPMLNFLLVVGFVQDDAGVRAVCNWAERQDKFSGEVYPFFLQKTTLQFLSSVKNLNPNFESSRPADPVPDGRAPEDLGE